MVLNNVQVRSEVKQRAFDMMQRNNLDRARELYEEVCRADRSDADSRYMLGVVYGRLKQFEAAADRFRQAISIQPQMVMAHCGLGTALKGLGKLPEAAESYLRAVRIKPDMVEIHFELASTLHVLGRLDEAKHHFQETLRLRPMVDAYFALANIQCAQGLFQDAIPNYQEALKLNPKRADIYHAFGLTFLSLGRLTESVECFQYALKHKPDFPLALENLAKALMMLGRIDESVSCLQEALRLKSDFVNTTCGIVTAYELGGNYQKAGEHLVPLLEKHPDNPAVALAFARLCKHLNRCREATDMMETVLQQKNLRPVDKKQLHFLAGKIYDSMNAYDKAFAHYQSANSIQPPLHDTVRQTYEVDAVISTLSADVMRRLPRASHGSERPVFILGMPRSGTSLVEQILASHPKVFGAGELTDISRIATRMVTILDAQLGFPQCIHKLTESVANTLAQDYLRCLEAMSTDAIRVTDKMPHNFFHLGIISSLFPQARVIHCTRDPLDTCLSIYFQAFSASHTYSFDLTHIGSHYREYERLMAHWRQVLDIRMLDVRYEDIVTNPDEMIRKLVDFCGLEWDPVCLRFYESKRLVATASYEQVRQPLHPKSIGRWKHYEQYLKPLKSALGMP